METSSHRSASARMNACSFGKVIGAAPMTLSIAVIRGCPLVAGIRQLQRGRKRSLGHTANRSTAAVERLAVDPDLAKSSQLRTTAFAGEFNRSMQHTDPCV